VAWTKLFTERPSLITIVVERPEKRDAGKKKKRRMIQHEDQRGGREFSGVVREVTVVYGEGLVLLRGEEGKKKKKKKNINQ